MTGKCLCREIEFTATEIPKMVFNCHCSRCRISHGADYTTQVFVVRGSLEFTKGQNKLKEYEPIGGIRSFCSNCGSRLMNYAKDSGDCLSIAITCRDNKYSGNAEAHYFTASKAIWHSLDQEIPSFESFPKNL